MYHDIYHYKKTTHYNDTFTRHTTHIPTYCNFNTSYQDFDILDHYRFTTVTALLLMKTWTAMTTTSSIRFHLVTLSYEHNHFGLLHDHHHHLLDTCRIQYSCRTGIGQMVETTTIQMKMTNGTPGIHDIHKSHVTGIKPLDLFEHDQDMELK